MTQVPQVLYNRGFDLEIEIKPLCLHHMIQKPTSVIYEIFIESFRNLFKKVYRALTVSLIHLLS